MEDRIIGRKKIEEIKNRYRVAEVYETHKDKGIEAKFPNFHISITRNACNTIELRDFFSPEPETFTKEFVDLFYFFQEFCPVADIEINCQESEVYFCFGKMKVIADFYNNKAIKLSYILNYEEQYATRKNVESLNSLRKLFAFKNNVEYAIIERKLQDIYL